MEKKYKNKSYLSEANPYHYSYRYDDAGNMIEAVRDKLYYYDTNQAVCVAIKPVRVAFDADSYGQFSYDIE